MSRRLSHSPLLALALWLSMSPDAMPAPPPPEGFTGCYAVTSDRADGARRRRVVEAENADRLFTPASVSKLATTAVALELLGPGFRVVTEIRAGGVTRDRTLHGDLVLVGAGDPTWSKRFLADQPTAALESLARQVASRIDRVEGDLVLDVSRFPGRPFPPSRAMSEIAYAYGAPTGALAVDDNVAWLRIAPGAKVGEPARAGWDGPAPYRLDNRTVTAPAARHERGTFDVLPVWLGDTLVLRGEYPISEPPYRLPVALHDGELRAGRALREALETVGVELGGNLRLSYSSSASSTSTRIATMTSPPVSEWLGEILGDSDNWLAEMLLRQIAFVKLGEGRTADGARFVVAELTRRAGLAAGAMELEDGSGLSPYDLMTPRAVVELLLWARTRPWWPVLAEVLPAPGNGTLAAWPGLPTSTRAKTGTLRHTVALAGFIGGGGGGSPTTYFACFVNHATEERSVLRRRLARRIAGWR